MLRRILSVFAALALCAGTLSGCSLFGKKVGDTGLYHAASDIAPDAILLTVDETDVPADRYLYWLTYNCDYLTESCAGEGKEADFTSPLGGGTLGSYAMEQALRTTVLYTEVELWAERYGCALTAEDDAALDAEWTAQCEKAGGEAAYLARLAWMGLDKDAARRLSGDCHLYAKLLTQAGEPGSSLYADDETVRVWAEKQGVLTVDYIRVAASDAADEAVRQEKRERAEMLLGKLTDSADPAGYFSTLAGAYSDDSERDDHPDGRTLSAGDGALPEAACTAAAALAENTASGIVESDGDFYILLRRPLDLAAARAARLDALLEQAADEAEIVYTAAYRGLDAADYYEKLTAARSRLNSTDSAASAFSPAASAASSPAAGASVEAAGSAG